MLFVSIIESKLFKFICYSLTLHLLILISIYIFHSIPIFPYKKRGGIRPSDSMQVSSISLSDLRTSLNTPSQRKKSTPPPKKKRAVPAKKQPVPQAKKKEKKPAPPKAEEKALPDPSEQTAASDQTSEETNVQNEPEGASSNQATGDLDASSGQPDGGSGTILEIQYINILKSKIKLFWQVPRELAELNLQAELRATINKNGEVTFREVFRSSGNETFDALMIKAIDSASPFPRPPTRNLEHQLSKEGAIFGFPFRH